MIGGDIKILEELKWIKRWSTLESRGSIRIGGDDHAFGGVGGMSRDSLCIAGRAEGTLGCLVGGVNGGLRWYMVRLLLLMRDFVSIVEADCGLVRSDEEIVSAARLNGKNEEIFWSSPLQVCRVAL